MIDPLDDEGGFSFAANAADDEDVLRGIVPSFVEPLQFGFAANELFGCVGEAGDVSLRNLGGRRVAEGQRGPFSTRPGLERIEWLRLHARLPQQEIVKALVVILGGQGVMAD